MKTVSPLRTDPETRRAAREASARAGTRAERAAPVLSFAESESRKGGVGDKMEKIQGAIRVLVASAIVWWCEAVDGYLPR